MKKEENLGMACKPHVLVLPYPRQGHINPMLQFAKLLAHKGLKVTFVPTISITKSMRIEAAGSVGIEPISDGFDDGHAKSKDGLEAYLDRFRAVGSQALTELIAGRMNGAVSCLVYDAILPWALDVAKRLGLHGAPFLTQPCTVDAIYYLVYRGSLALPLVHGSTSGLPGLPQHFEASELPSFVTVPEYSPAHFRLFVNQFSNMGDAAWVFCNTFQELESEVINWMAGFMPVKAIGPMVPSTYLRNYYLEGDRNYGADLFEANSTEECMSWLAKREPNSTVYVSFGTVASLSLEQTEELAWGLQKSNCHFLWVVRTSEENKLPAEFMEETKEKGLVVAWCPQMEVLAHEAIGCFVTHCGWNSTLEAISLGVPMVAMPQWTDQPTNAKCVEDIWGVGLRARADGKDNIVRRDEIDRCVRMLMEGEKAKEVKRNAAKWRELATRALMEDGSSSKNVEDFVAGLSAASLPP